MTRGEAKSIKAKVARLERDLKAAEAKLEDYVFIDKKPDYFFSFSGFLIFRKWYLQNGLMSSQAEMLIILSYMDIFLYSHFKLYTRNHTRGIGVKIVLQSLIDQKYVTKIKVSGKSKSRLRSGWVLTQRGKDLESDYERFYDNKMAELKKRAMFTFNMESGMYFRKVRLNNSERRLLQGVSKLPKSGSFTGNAFVEQDVLTKRYEEI